MQKFKRGKTQVKLSKNQQTLPFWLLTGIKINKIHKVLYAFFEITFLPKSDRFRRPNIWLETNFCDVAQTLEIQWFRLKFALLRHLQLNQNVNISKDVCKKSPPPVRSYFSHGFPSVLVRHLDVALQGHFLHWSNGFLMTFLQRTPQMASNKHGIINFSKENEANL